MFADVNFRISPGLTPLFDSPGYETHAGCIYGLMLKMMLAGVTLVGSRGCVNCVCTEYGVCPLDVLYPPGTE